MKLLCIDFSNLIVRQAANPYGHHKDLLGRPVWGTVGAVAQVLRLIDQQQPTHLLIAKDGKREDSFRRELDEAYKAHRDEEVPDADLMRQFKLAYQVVEIFSWPCIHVAHHEADDVIASACSSFPEWVEVVSGDKDMLALCSERVTVHLLRPGGVEDLNVAGCKRLLGVEPRQVRDYKALVGDKSDGITGVEGIGPVNAVKLLDAYGSLVNIYKQIDEDEEMGVVTKAIRTRLINGRDQARLSWKLGGMVSSLPIDVETLKLPERPTWELHESALSELGLQGLEKALTGRVGEKKRDLDLDLVFDQMTLEVKTK